MASRKNLFSQAQLMDAERILINPLNHSTSKQQYSFPKAERWSRCKTHNDNYKFYQLPTTKSKIAPTIGTSKRQSLSRQGVNPSPSQYSYVVDGEFGNPTLSKRSSTKGIVFGLGRSDIKINSFLKLKTDIPPPNAYNAHANGQHMREFSFSREKKFRNSSRQSLSNVGPGSYKVVGSLEQNKQILSTQHRHASPKIQDIRVDSRKKSNDISPPIYHPRTTAKGEELDLSKRKRGFRIGTSKRTDLARGADVPGPGRYKVFSQFISKGKS